MLGSLDIILSTPRIAVPRSDADRTLLVVVLIRDCLQPLNRRLASEQTNKGSNSGKLG
jgi:hypothetical protein